VAVTGRSTDSVRRVHTGWMADDPDIQHRIRALIDEEHRLRDALADGEISLEEEHQRLRRVEVELDQCWDLLRQRRARREHRQAPGQAAVRSEGTVENYRQ
jgi:predicted nuclease with TOPRIM domain